MLDYHPPASQSLTNIRPPKPILVKFFFPKSGTLFFSQKYLMPSTLFSDSLMQPSSPPKIKTLSFPKIKTQKPKTQLPPVSSRKPKQSKNPNAISEVVRLQSQYHPSLSSPQFIKDDNDSGTVDFSNLYLLTLY